MEGANAAADAMREARIVSCMVKILRNSMNYVKIVIILGSLFFLREKNPTIMRTLSNVVERSFSRLRYRQDTGGLLSS